MRLRLPRFIPRETFLMALDSIRAHKFRSTLTVLGIVVGLLVAILVAAVLTGMRGNIVKMVEEYGTNNIYAFHLTTGPQLGERDQAERTRKPLTPEDAEAIAAQASAVKEVGIEAPNIGGWGSGFDDTISVNGKT
ncbi:MAG: ABC transporter permease, partial [Acidobacteria bacterium]|nr:ABC transporter permease [Acidobacteriota bacterium]